MANLRDRVKRLESVVSVSNEITPFLLELWQIEPNLDDPEEPPQEWIDWFMNTTHEERIAAIEEVEL